MKWYFASRMRHKENLAKVVRQLELQGESVTSGWVHEGSLKPYYENLEKVQEMAQGVVSSVLEADIFVLISDAEGTDMFIELGICLAKNKITPDSVKIYIIGEHSKRSLMQLHPSIKHLRDIEELFKEEKIERGDFVFPNFS